MIIYFWISTTTYCCLSSLSPATLCPDHLFYKPLFPFGFHKRAFNPISRFYIYFILSSSLYRPCLSFLCSQLSKLFWWWNSKYFLSRRLFLPSFLLALFLRALSRMCKPPYLVVQFLNADQTTFIFLLFSLGRARNIKLSTLLMCSAFELIMAI